MAVVIGVSRVVFAGHSARPADLVRDAVGEADAVAGGEGDDVGAGDGARAAPLHGGLGGVDHLEAAEARLVRGGVALRLPAAGVHCQEDRTVTALCAVVVVCYKLINKRRVSKTQSTRY